MSNYQLSQSGSKNHQNMKPSMCSSEVVSRVEAVQIQLEEERKRRMDVEKQIQDFILQRGGPQAAAVAKILKEGDLASMEGGGGGSKKSSSSKNRGAGGSVRSSSSRHYKNQNDNFAEDQQQQFVEDGSQRGSVRSMASSSNRSHQSQRSTNQNSASYGRQLVLPPMNSSTTTTTAVVVPQPPNRAGSNLSSTHNHHSKNNSSSTTKPKPVLLSNDEDIVVKCEREAAECDKLIRQLNHSHASVLSRKPQLPQAARGISKKNGATAQTGAAGCDYVLARRSKATPAQLYMMNQWHQERMDKINNFTFGIAGGGAY